MGVVIGMDEAGYGPNLGPLVVTVTAWEVPDPPGKIDFWQALDAVVGQSPSRDGSKLHIADSKQVYSPSRGLGPLERSVLSVLTLTGPPPENFGDLLCRLTMASNPTADAGPWFAGTDLSLPHDVSSRTSSDRTDRLRNCCAENGIRLRSVRSDVVFPQRFNRLVREYDSKGLALSRISLALLRQVWDPDAEGATSIVADKHGGRNRYDQLLAEVVGDHMVLRRQEGRELSCYRVGNSEIRFQTRAESQFPVAVASMVSKYVRELAMALFNRFWQNHVADLKPTKGYPVDARRFRQEIAAAQQRLDIDDDVLWRVR